MSPNSVQVNSNWNLQMSNFAKATVNPHRQMAENSKVVPNPSKQVITLQMGLLELLGISRNSL
jgi:hypothetical protein